MAKQSPYVLGFRDLGVDSISLTADTVLETTLLVLEAEKRLAEQPSA